MRKNYLSVKLVFMENDSYFYKNKYFKMTQDFAFRKLNLFRKLTELQNEDEDWGKALTEKDQANIEQGLKDIEEGRTISLEE